MRYSISHRFPFLNYSKIWVKNVAQLVECLPSIHKSPGLISTSQKLGSMIHSCNPTIHSHFHPHIEYEDNLRFTRPCLKKIMVKKIHNAYVQCISHKLFHFKFLKACHSVALSSTTLLGGIVTHCHSISIFPAFPLLQLLTTTRSSHSLCDYSYSRHLM